MNHPIWLAIIASVILSTKPYKCCAQGNVIVPLSSEEHGAGSSGNGTWDYLFTAVDDGTGLRATNPFENENSIDFSQWANLDFDISQTLQTDGRVMSWQQAPAPFGFGDAAFVGTNLPVPSAGHRDAVHFFRYEFTTTETFSDLQLKGIIDDGAVVYLDGIPVSSMSSCCKDGANTAYDPISTGRIPSYRDRATVSNGPTRREGEIYTEPIDIPNLQISPGQHVLAASLHSISANSADMRFDLGLFADSFTSPSQYIGDPDNNNGSFSAVWGEPGANVSGLPWSSSTTPGLPGDIARLLDVPTRPTSVLLNHDVSLGQLILDNDHGYAIGGFNELRFDTGAAASASIEVRSGSHELQSRVAIDDATDVSVSVGSNLEFNNTLWLDEDLTISGGGNVAFNNRVVSSGGVVQLADASLSGSGVIEGDLQNNGGVVTVDGSSNALTINGNYLADSSSQLDFELGQQSPDALRIHGHMQQSGQLRVTLADNFSPSAGRSFLLFDAGTSTGSFDQLELATLSGGLEWDTSALSEGKLSVVPEPSGAVILLLGLGILARMGILVRKRGS